MSASNRPSGPAKPQNEQREVVTDREGLEELALQQAPVDDGDVADSDEFAVAEAIGDVQPGGEDDSGTPSAPGADRPARDAEPDADTSDDGGPQRSRP